MLFVPPAPRGGLSLALHMVLAACGIGMPVLMLMGEGLWLRTGRPHHRDLAWKWGTFSTSKRAREPAGGPTHGTK
jgi:hypothetical protein